MLDLIQMEVRVGNRTQDRTIVIEDVKEGARLIYDKDHPAKRFKVGEGKFDLETKELRKFLEEAMDVFRHS